MAMPTYWKDAIHEDVSPGPESVCPQTFVLGRCIPCIFRPLDDTDVVWLRISGG
jgi:hypothetical protein